MSCVYAVTSPNVIRETFDDESVIVNLDTGSYYSLQGTAASIWKLMEDGHSDASIEQQLTLRHSGAPGEIQSSCREFLAELVAERLIVRVEETGSVAPADCEKNASPSEFVRPTLQKFSDMQELLLLDPIHDTDATGWPARKA